MSWTDRGGLIACSPDYSPRPRRLGLLATPVTILRWHRQLLGRSCRGHALKEDDQRLDRVAYGGASASRVRQNESGEYEQDY
jgi:hypothetical protein